MRTLTVENKVFEIDRVPETNTSVWYGSLDCSSSDYQDFRFQKLILMESFYSPCVILEIGEFILKAPLHWSIFVTDEDFTTLMAIPITSLNNRGFKTLVCNALDSKILSAEEIEIANVYTDVKWYTPHLKNGHVLVVPLEDGHNPRCVLLTDVTNKIMSSLDICELFHG